MPQVRKDVAVLVGEGGSGLVRQLEAALGYRVTTLRWADANASMPELSDEECGQVAARVGEAAGSRVMLIPDGGTVRVLSYS